VPSFSSGQPERAAVAEIARSVGVLVRSGHHLREQAEQAGRTSGVRWSAYPPMAALVERGPQRVTDLAERLHLSPSSVSRILPPLIAAGLVERHPDVQDGRASVVGVTPAGRRMFERMVHERDLTIGEAIEGWAADDLERLARLLPRLVQALGLEARHLDGFDEPGTANRTTPHEQTELGTA
jgi:DNA-binding MarR family transcriptional regulator